MNQEFSFMLVLCLLSSFFVNVQLSSSGAEASGTYPVHNIDSGLNYTAIQEAIDAIETLNGHTIRADAGIYYEHITIGKQVTLAGESRDVTIIDGNGTGTVVLIAADHVNISDFTIQNAGRTWLSPQHYNIPDACIRGSNIANANIKNNIITGAAVCVSFIGSSSFIEITRNIVNDAVFMGIMSYSVRNAVICDNLVQDFGYEGIHLDGGCNGCKIARNRVMEGRVGISLERQGTSGNMIEDNFLFDNNASIGLYGAATNVFRRNNMTSNQLVFLMLGYALGSFMQDIDDSNTANGKTLYYLTNRSNLTIDVSNHLDLGCLVLVNCTKTIITDLDLSLSKDGLVLAYCTDCIVENLTLRGNHPQLIWGGLMMFGSTNNTIINNKIGNNSYGACLYHSDSNTFHHNCFVDNDVSVVPDFSSPFRNSSSGYVSQNVWDNGLEGNFWSGYSNADLDHDGIGDVPYVIDANNTDNCPLMGMYYGFNVSWIDSGHEVEIVSNSSVSAFDVGYWIEHPENPNTRFIAFNVTGETDTNGFCRILIPTALMNTTHTVRLNGTEIPYTLLPCSNSTHSYLYFNYTHSTQEVTIIPEFPSFLILPLFFMATLLAVTTYRRRRCRFFRQE